MNKQCKCHNMDEKFDGNCHYSQYYDKCEHCSKHIWFKFKDDKFESCKKCGIIRRGDKKEKECPGKISISLRSSE